VADIFAGLFAAGVFGGGPSTISPTLATPSSPIMGSADSDIWNEQIPGSGGSGGFGSINTGTVFGSGNTSPFVFSFNSAYHIGMTLNAGGSWPLAWKVAWVDFRHGSQGTDAAHTRWHAMGGGIGTADAVGAYNEGYQTCGEAYGGTVAELRNAGGDQALAIHIIQDSYSASHGYQNWYGSLTLAHEQGDFAINSTTSNATDATRRYLQAANGRAPIGSPESYLAPRPANCR
jgi:hypothetical protein